MPMNPIILFVDVISAHAKALREVLQGEEVEVLSARSAAAGLDLLLTHDVALAVVDVRMPERQGVQFVDALREMERTFFHPQNLDEAAARLGLSRRRFTQLFRAAAGDSSGWRLPP